MIRFAPALLVLALDVFCLIDVITSDENRVRGLPKIAWFLVILFFPLIGSIVWLIAGRPQNAAVGGGGFPGPSSAYPEYDRPGRATGATPESDEEFLRRIRERAEEQRRRATEQKQAQEQQDEDGSAT